MRPLLIVPAAGLGSRLQASLPKAMVPVAGRPMIDHLLSACEPYIGATIVIAHPSFAASVREHLGKSWPQLPSSVVEQPAPTGMLDAILLAAPGVQASSAQIMWIIWCDQVGVLPATLERLAAATASPSAPPSMVIATVRRSDPYIHFERDGDGRIARVRQRREGDAMPAEGESDMGLFALSRDAYLRQLPHYAADVPPGGGTGERNFLPFIPWLAARADVQTIPATDPREAIGVNTPDELAAAESWLRTRVNHS